MEITKVKTGAVGKADFKTQVITFEIRCFTYFNFLCTLYIILLLQLSVSYNFWFSFFSLLFCVFFLLFLFPVII